MKLFGTSLYKRSNSFVHAPLNDQEPSIRLIQILPNLSKYGRIQCKIRHTSIHDVYYCLSYVWGPKENSRSIEINKKAYAIRSNLLNFLDNARRKQHFLDRWLWIDALCINQENTKERIHQVQQMGHIYSNAIGVVSWLGPCEQIAAFLREPLDRKIHGTAEFFASQYWDRAWITQELALARSVTFMALDAEADRRLVPFEYYRELRRPSSRRNTIISENSRKLKGRSLFFLLDLTGAKHCEVARDSVFSLLSLSGDGNLVAVDYCSQHSLLASNILRSCSETFCLCSLRALRHKLPDSLPTDLDKLTPLLNIFAQVTIPIGDLRVIEWWQSSPNFGLWRTMAIGGVTLTTVVLNLSHICDACWRCIAFRIDSSKPEVTYTYMDNLAKLGTYEFRRALGCIVQLHEDISMCTIKFSFATLWEIAAGIGPRDSPYCQLINDYGTTSASTVRKSVLKLCLDED